MSLEEKKDKEDKEVDGLLAKKTWPLIEKQHNGDLSDRERVGHVRRTCSSCSFHSSISDIFFTGNAVLLLIVQMMVVVEDNANCLTKKT